MSIVSALKGVTKVPTNSLQEASDALLGGTVKQAAPEVSDGQYAKESFKHFRTNGTLNRDGSLRSPTQEGPISIPSFQKYKASNDIRGLSDAIRNVRSHKFNTSGGGAGAGILEEALGKPAWQHSGRKVRIINMAPTEYLAKSAKGHGMDYEELLHSLAQGDRVDSIIDGMSEGTEFAAPYLDYRGGNFAQEGQHRAYAAAMMGQDRIPVAVLWDDVKKIDLGEPNQVNTGDTRAMAEMGDTPKHAIAGATPDNVLIAKMNAELGRDVRGVPPADDGDLLRQMVKDIAGEDIEPPKNTRKAENKKRMERRDEQGYTKETFYHSTPAGVDFDEFKPFSHFGTQKAASERMETMGPQSHHTEAARNEMKPRTIPVHIKVDNPLEVIDNGLSDANQHFVASIKGLLDKVDDATLEGYIKGYQRRNLLGKEEETYEYLANMLENLGYDGLSYLNKVEDTGSQSIVPIRPQQIRSVNAEFKDPTSPSMMAGGAGAAVVAGAANEADASSMQATATEAAPLLDKIGELEGNNRYDIEYGGGTVDFPNMTIQEVLDHQDKRKKAGAKSTAVGKYQFINKTLAELVKRNPKDFPKDRMFDKATQDELASILLKRRGYDKFKAGKITRDEFVKNLSKEWASLPNPSTGKSYYDGDGLNHSLMSTDDLRAIVDAL